MTFLSSPLNRALIIGAIVIIIGLLAFFMVVQPLTQQYDASNARLQQDITTYDDLKRVADQKPVYIALEHQIETRLNGVETTADPRVYIPSYLKQIENLAKQDGLDVTAVTPQAAPAPSPGASGAPAPIQTVSPHVTGIAPISSASRVAGEANAQAQTTNGVAQATGATPIPGSAPAAGAPGTAAGTAAAGGRVPPGAASSTARANAIAYLNNSFTQVPINMEMSGTYAQLEKFLRDLNKFPKLIGVGNLTLSPNQNTGVGETPTLTIVLPIVAYRLSPSAGPAPAASPAPAAGNGG